jgi:hypothetical protein
VGAEGDPIEPRNRRCPQCGATTVTLPRFASRRVSPVTCTGCGAKLRRVLPGIPYYLLSFAAAILLEGSFLPAIFLGLQRQWLWIVAIIVALVAFNLATSAFLNSRTRVEYENPDDARRDRPGRWYPEDRAG